jgi:hypothetical protein
MILPLYLAILSDFFKKKILRQNLPSRFRSVFEDINISLQLFLLSDDFLDRGCSKKTKNTMNDNIKLDALLTILEKHLYDFDEDSETEVEFIENIVEDYLLFLDSRKVIIPRKWKAQIVDELKDQVRKMLIKKMYGCLNVKDYVTTQVRAQTKEKTVFEERKQTVKRKYKKLY